jgi:hypothetical protein
MSLPGAREAGEALNFVVLDFAFAGFSENFHFQGLKQFLPHCSPILYEDLMAI